MKFSTILTVLLLATAASLSAFAGTETKTTTTTTISSSLNPSTYGQAVTFTAVVSPAPPNGEAVTFMQGKNTLGAGVLSNGSASFTTSALTGGTYAIKAVYGGDATFAGSTSKAVSQVVNPEPTTTSLASSENPKFSAVSDLHSERGARVERNCDRHGGVL